MTKYRIADRDTVFEDRADGQVAVHAKRTGSLMPVTVEVLEELGVIERVPPTKEDIVKAAGCFVSYEDLIKPIRRLATFISLDSKLAETFIKGAAWGEYD